MVDARIIKLVESSGFGYEVDDDGDVKILLQWADSGRTQFVFLDGTVDEFGSYADVDVWSPVADVTRFATDELRNLVFWEAVHALAPRKFGGISIRGNYLVVKADIPLSLEPQTFRDMVWVVAKEADRLENALTGEEDSL
jgi:hypothetical protein